MKPQLFPGYEWPCTFMAVLSDQYETKHMPSEMPIKSAVAETFVVAVPENPEYAREPEMMDNTITKHTAMTPDFTDVYHSCVN